MKKCLVLGAGGFLGGHLEHRLKADGHFVVSVARHRPRYRESVADEYVILDLAGSPECHHYFVRHKFDRVYQLAAETGGLGFIGDSANDAAILTNSLKINMNVLEAMARTGQQARIFFASSQCVYPTLAVDPFARERIELNACREEDARFENNFAFAQEKLYAEALYHAYASNHGFEIRIGRLGNTYGPYCTWDGPKAKAVAAICRKVFQAPYAGTVELWGSGDQIRSFTYVNDAVEGIVRLMESDYDKPVNIASSEMVTVERLFEKICNAAGRILGWQSVPGPVGVAGRNSDNTLARKVLNWQPSIPLENGLWDTYPWVAAQK